MANKLTVKRVVDILKKIPEKRFRIMDLAPQLIDEKGIIDVVKVVDRQGELNMAIVEVQTYIHQVRGLTEIMESVGGEHFNGYGDDEEGEDEPEDTEDGE